VLQTVHWVVKEDLVIRVRCRNSVVIRTKCLRELTHRKKTWFIIRTIKKEIRRSTKSSLIIAQRFRKR